MKEIEPTKDETLVQKLNRLQYLLGIEERISSNLKQQLQAEKRIYEITLESHRKGLEKETKKHNSIIKEQQDANKLRDKLFQERLVIIESQDKIITDLSQSLEEAWAQIDKCKCEQ